MKYWILLVTLLSNFIVYAQSRLNLEAIVPPAPNAAELGKYGTMPVGTLTGIPDISFPLYEINTGKLKLPITLSYHAAGIQVSQRATDVGLGWSLNAGGQISRTVFGGADNSTYGNFNYLSPDYTSLVSINSYYTMQLYSNGGYDTNPDLFVYNFGKKSGKFIYTRERNFLTIPFDPIKIQVNNPASRTSATFQITDDNGVIYKFNNFSNTNPDWKVSDFNISTWYLTYMISADQTDTISLEYQVNNINDQIEQQVYSIGQAKTCNGADVMVTGPLDIHNNTINYNELQIKKIKFRTGYILFNRNTKRDDFFESTYSLDELNIYDYNANLIKSIAFTYSYYNAGESNVPTYANKRLKLNSFFEKDPSANLKKEYKFDYDATNLPSISSHNMDYWGYYNGANNGSVLIPSTTLYSQDLSYVSYANGESYINSFNSPYIAYSIGNANREPSAPSMKAGILNRITYPTGGYSGFDFEPHQFLSEDYITQNRAATCNVIGVNKQTLSESITNFRFPGDANYDFSNQGDICVANFTINFSPSNIGNQEFGETQVVTLTNHSNGSVQTWKHEGDLTLPYTVQVSIPLSISSSYSLKNSVYGPNTVTIFSSLTWIENTNQQKIKIGGGLRIKSIKSYHADNKLSNEVHYVYGSGQSGVGTKMFDEQIFYKNYEDIAGTYYSPPGTPENSFCFDKGTRWQRQFMGISKYNSISYQGSSILYPEVTKYEGSPTSNIGKTIYSFSINQDQTTLPKEFLTSSNYGSTNTSWNIADLVKEEVFKFQNNDYSIVSQVIYEYGILNPVTTSGIMIKQIRNPLKNCGYCEFQCPTGPDCYNSHAGQGFFSIYSYPIKSGIKKITKESKTIYGQNGSLPGVTTITEFSYENPANRYLSSSKVNLFSTAAKVTRLKYPHDFSDPVSIAMVSKNIISPVLEEKLYKSISGTETLLSTLQTSYKQLGKLIEKDKISFSTGSIAPEPRIQFNSYDFLGNILEQQKTNDVKQTYVWGYKSQYPIAEVINPTGDVVAFSSFEDLDKGNWTYTGIPFADGTAPTGRKIYNLVSGSLSKSGLTTSANYVVSYWAKNGGPLSISGTQATYPRSGNSLNGWTYFEHLVTGISSLLLTGSALVDEVRLYPGKAKMTTYTYDPLVGITNKCDLNGRITSFEYDDLKRLMLIRDQDNNILKKYCYQFYNKPENCNIYYNDVQFGSFARNNCSPGYTGNTVLYTVPANTYSSNLSVLEANAKAIADVSSNGQIYANSVGTCTLVSNCDGSNCSGVNKKCVYGLCETGVKIYTSSVQVHGSLWECTYHYEWSNGTWSQNYVEYQSSMCYFES